MRKLLGAHMSIAGGFNKALDRALSINTDCLQIFTKSNRQWRAKPILPEDAKLFRNSLEAHEIRAIIAHASYLINVASENPEVATKSTAALTDELQRCEVLGVPSLVLHPGNRGGLSEDVAIKQIANNINVSIEQSASTMVLLENMAGQGSSVAHSFENIAAICSLIEDKSRVGVCFDTCHAYAAGYDLNKKYGEVWQKFERTIGMDKLKAIHLNDSKKPLGSKVDRHENIGKGYLEVETFRKIMNDQRLESVVKILETPIEKDELEYAVDLNTLLNLVELKIETKKRGELNHPSLK